jgi:hypothetical protein
MLNFLNGKRAYSRVNGIWLYAEESMKRDHGLSAYGPFLIRRLLSLLATQFLNNEHDKFLGDQK